LRDKKNNTLLHHAAKYGQVTSINFLLAQGVHINPKGWLDTTPLHVAATKGHLDVVKKLVEAGADIDARDTHGHTPFEVAATHKQTEVMLYLCEQGAKADTKCPNGNLLHMTANQILQETTELNGQEWEARIASWNI
jgi:ankyrin repeat protein